MPGKIASAAQPAYQAAQAQITAKISQVQGQLNALASSVKGKYASGSLSSAAGDMNQYGKLEKELKALKACDYYHKNFMKAMMDGIKGYEYIGDLVKMPALMLIINLAYPVGSPAAVPYTSMHQHTFGLCTDTEWDAVYSNIKQQLEAKENRYNVLSRMATKNFGGTNNATLDELREVMEMRDILRACKIFHEHIKNYVRNYYYTTTAVLVPLFAPCGTLVIP